MPLLLPGNGAFPAAGYLHPGGTEDDVKPVSHWVVADFDSSVREAASELGCQALLAMLQHPGQLIQLSLAWILGNASSRVQCWLETVAFQAISKAALLTPRIRVCLHSCHSHDEHEAAAAAPCSPGSKLRHSCLRRSGGPGAAGHGDGVPAGEPAGRAARARAAAGGRRHLPPRAAAQPSGPRCGSRAWPLCWSTTGTESRAISSVSRAICVNEQILKVTSSLKRFSPPRDTHSRWSRLLLLQWLCRLT